MKMYRDTLIAGRTAMVRCYASTRVATEKGKKRKPKMNPTPEAVQRINLKNAIWNLCVLMNSYFVGGDYHLTLTYAHEPSKEEAKRDLDKWIRNMRTYCRKRGQEFSWVAVTEYENKRIHHHIVCSRVDMDLVKKYWTKGWINIKLLDASGNYIKLAEYLIKETDKTFREDDSPNKARYRRSRNMKYPEAQREEVSDRALRNGPAEVKGYYIDQDTLHTYDHAILGVECMQYIMVSLEEIPRLNRWYRGRKVKFEGEYRILADEQLTIDGLLCAGETGEIWTEKC